MLQVSSGFIVSRKEGWCYEPEVPGSNCFWLGWCHSYYLEVRVISLDSELLIWNAELLIWNSLCVLAFRHLEFWRRSDIGGGAFHLEVGLVQQYSAIKYLMMICKV